MNEKSDWVPGVTWTTVVAIILLSVGAVIYNIGTSKPSGHGITRAQSEIKALSSAIENYKIDNGKYPSDPSTTEQLQPGLNFDPAAYVAASEFLYRALSGDLSETPQSPESSQPKAYFAFIQNQIRVGKSGHKYIVDPQGNSYGYSTFKAVHLDSNAGYNPTFDLWSTNGGKSAEDKQKWLINW